MPGCTAEAMTGHPSGGRLWATISSMERWQLTERGIPTTYEGVSRVPPRLRLVTTALGGPSGACSISAIHRCRLPRPLSRFVAWTCIRVVLTS